MTEDVPETPAAPGTGYRSRRDTGGDRVMKAIDRLQESHRLLYHSWEYFMPGMFPYQTLEALESDGIDTALCAENPPPNLLSVSMPPAASSGRAIRPYGVFQYDYCPNPAYLFDMTQDQPDAPRVVYAAPWGLCSDEDKVTGPRAKRVFGHNEGNIEPLRELYSSVEADRIQSYAKAAGSRGAEHTERQMDAIGNYYNTPQCVETALTEEGSNQPGTLHDYNELVVCASPTHLKAIAIPVSAINGDMREKKMPYLQLLGACCGLQHLNRGIDLPVVYYDLASERGKFLYLGQGRKELTDLALQAVRQIQAKMPGPGEKTDFSMKQANADASHLAEGLGIDMGCPLDEQTSILRQLRAHAKSSETIDR